MGLPLIATPILASVFGPRQAVVIITIPIFVANTLLVLQSWRVLGYLRTLVPLIVANAAGTVLGALLLAGLDQKTFAVLITAMVALFLARGERIVGEPGARRAQLLTPVVGFVGGVMQGTTSISSPVIGSYFHAMNLAARVVRRPRSLHRRARDPRRDRVHPDAHRAHGGDRHPGPARSSPFQAGDRGPSGGQRREPALAHVRRVTHVLRVAAT